MFIKTKSGFWKTYFTVRKKIILTISFGDIWNYKYKYSEWENITLAVYAKCKLVVKWYVCISPKKRNSSLYIIFLD